MDGSSKPLQEIQYWLYDKAKSYGFTIQKRQPYNFGCVFYKKGSKSFLCVGEMEVDEQKVVFSKVIFRKIFTFDMDKVNALAKRMPGIFGNSWMNCGLCSGTKDVKLPCRNRIEYELEGKKYKNCSCKSFYFYNPSLEDIKLILELFLIENKIK